MLFVNVLRMSVLFAVLFKVIKYKLALVNYLMLKQFCIRLSKHKSANTNFRTVNDYSASRDGPSIKSILLKYRDEILQPPLHFL